MGETQIEVKKLSCKSGTRFLLHQIDWTVEKGQHWVVFGINGSGKTTLLSAVSGYRNYTSGSVKLFGEGIDENNIFSMRRRVGWVSSSFFDNFYKNETALEIILAGKTGTLGLDYSVNEKDVKKAKGLLKQFYLVDKCNRPFNTLSKGERQKVLLVRALLNDPEILVLDEPCSGLDIMARERVLKMVEQITEKTDTTVIYVTHYPEELLGVFTHAMLLKKGKCFAQGTMEECFNDEVISAYLDRPATIAYDKEGRMQIHCDMGLDEWGRIESASA